MIVVYLKLFSCQIDETWNFQSRHLSRSGRVSVYVCVRVYFWAVQTNCSHMRVLCVNNIGNIIENRSRKMHSTPLSFDRDQSILEIGYGAILNAKWQMVRNGYVFAKARKRERATEWIREPITLKCSISFKVILTKYTTLSLSFSVLRRKCV